MPLSKTKICQNCNIKFTIEPEDFEFYKKIDVPEPTFCPECRMQRRFGSRNHRKLYKRKCDFSGEEIISIFHSSSPYKVYDQKIWWSDKWDAMEYGHDYDFSKPFFEQFDELAKNVPWPSLRIINSVNCDYCNGMINGKNCYMSTGYEAENCLYMDGAAYAKECVDSALTVKCERMYEGNNCNNCYNLAYCTYCDNCINSTFLYDCRNCQSCFGCVNLRNKKYHIFNQPYTKTEYEKEIKKYDLGNYQTLLKVKNQFDRYSLKFPKRWAQVAKSVNVTGNNINFSKNCHYCFYVKEGAEDCKFIHLSGLALKDSYDVLAGGGKSELMYEVDFVIESGNVISSGSLGQCHNLAYTMESYFSSNLFGCIGLRHKKYCILNKQYSKQNYKNLVTKIRKQMINMPYKDKKGRIYQYGEFFPLELSRFGYNETNAWYYCPLTKKQVLAKGYLWRNKDKLDYQPTIKADNLPDHIDNVNDTILKEIIECQNVKSNNCVGSDVYRIIPAELKFYKKHNLSLPRICPYCRYYQRVRGRNMSRLYQKQCMCAGEKSDKSKAGNIYQNTTEHKHKNKPCPNTFQTTYAPDRKEIVYCESCYNKEVS